MSWKTIGARSRPLFPLTKRGYLVGADGTLDIYTLVPGYFALLQDVAAPTKPGDLRGHFFKRKLLLKWQASSDNSGAIAGYQVTLDGAPVGRSQATRKAPP